MKKFILAATMLVTGFLVSNSHSIFIVNQTAIFAVKIPIKFSARSISQAEFYFC